MATQNVCSWNKFGFCKHKEKCRKFHEKEVCVDKECDISKCSLRHPKTCKYYMEFKMCKFVPCAFKHIESNDDTEKLKKENKVLLEKIDIIGKDLEILFQKEVESASIIEKLQTRSNSFAKEGSEKVIGKLENEVKDLNLKVFEQDKKIEIVTKKLSILKEKENNLKELQDKYDNLLTK